MNPEIWKILQLEPIRDRDAIRRAYARRLKVTSPEDDAEGFLILRQAYEEALAALDWDWAWDRVRDEPDDAPPGDDGLDLDEGDPAGGHASQSSDADLMALLNGALRVQTPRPALEPQTLAGHDAHERLLAELERLTTDPDEVEPTRLEAALEAVITAPAMEDLSVAVHTEQRLLHLITTHPPRSDALVRPAINAFRWSRDRIGLHDDGLIEAVLNRDADIIFRDGLRRHDDRRRTAFLALTRPLDPGPAWRDRYWPGFEKAMSDLLVEIHDRRPSLRADVNLETLDAWTLRLSKPRLSPGLIALAVLGPLAPALIALLTTENLALGFGAYLLGVALCLTAASAWVHGLLPLRQAWRDLWEWRMPLAARVGWWPASLALLIAAAFAPASPWATLAVGSVAVVVTFWAMVTGEIAANPGADGWPRPVQILISQGALAGWWGLLRFTHPEAATTPLAIAFIGAAIASAIGFSSLPILWFHWLARAPRLALTALLFVATLGAAWLTLQARNTPALAPIALALTTTAVLGQRPLAAGLDSHGLQWRYRIMMFSVSGMFGLGSTIGWLPSVSLWFLLGTLVSLMTVLLVENNL